MSTNHKSFLILAVIVSVLNGKCAQNIYNGLYATIHEMNYSSGSTAIQDLNGKFGEFKKFQYKLENLAKLLCALMLNVEKAFSRFRIQNFM